MTHLTEREATTELRAADDFTSLATVKWGIKWLKPCVTRTKSLISFSIFIFNGSFEHVFTLWLVRNFIATYLCL